jgi:MFS family permease
MIFLLRDENYFNVSPDEIGLISSSIIFYAILVQVFVTLIYGYIFDIMGRKLTLFITVFTQGICLTVIPFLAPNVFPGVLILRIIYAVASIGPMCSPLINDYVSKGSRGRASALLQMGVISGDFFYTVVLLNLVRPYSIGVQF